MGKEGQWTGIEESKFLINWGNARSSRLTYKQTTIYRFTVLFLYLLEDLLTYFVNTSVNQLFN